jgi:predicted nuclease of predicted toxin-antitoxin system
MLKSLLVAALTAATFSTAALAQQPQRGGTPEEQKACAKDVSRFCRQVMNDSDLVILSCLQQNRPKISQSCNKVLVSHGQ